MKIIFEGDAEQCDFILSLIRDEINKCDMNILECMSRNDLNYLQWWQIHKSYAQSIIDKIAVENDYCGSRAGEVKLPYKPDSFTIKELKKAIKEVKK